MTKLKARAIAAIIAAAGAFAPMLVALQMLADNNNNGELFDTVTGEWNVGYALSFSALFYVPSFVLIFAITLALTSPRGGNPDR
jgi:hypothetical protein